MCDSIHLSPLRCSVGAVLLLSVCTFAAAAQSTPAHTNTSGDATWAKAYATSCPDRKYTCASSTNGYENAFNGDPRLPELLKHSLPQRESWWVNGYGGSAPVSSIVQEFIGVPGDLLVDDNRYVTATGCVPHDCLTNGMLWIDTGTEPASVVFVAEVSIESFKGDAGNHLWLYASKSLNFEALPADLLTSITRWHNSVNSSKTIFSQRITVATLIQPNGRIRDLTYDMLFYIQNEPHFPKLGAKQ